MAQNQSQQTQEERDKQAEDDASIPFASSEPPTPATFWSPFIYTVKIYFCPPQSYPIIKSIFLRQGHGVAAWYVVAAAVLNHLRRYCIPWFGRHLWKGSKVAHMKLARHAPHYYLEETLDFTTAQDFLWIGQIALYSFVKLFLWAQLVNEARPTQPRVVVAIIMILHLTISFTSMEYDFAELCWGVTTLYSVKAVLRGTKQQKSFAYKMLTKEPIIRQAGAQLLALVHAVNKFWETMNKCKGWTSGIAVFLAVGAYSTVHVVRYSNRYFMLLEMSDMLLTLFWIFLGVSLVGLDKIRSLQTAANAPAQG